MALGVDHSEGGDWKKALRHAADQASGGGRGVRIQSTNSTVLLDLGGRDVSAAGTRA